jgi:hypothetical protein
MVYSSVFFLFLLLVWHWSGYLLLTWFAEVDLMAGHQMNHDFQFFFQTVAHPEVNRFLTQAKDWIRLQLQILGDEGEMARLKRKEESISQYHQKHSGHCEIKRLEKAASMVTSPVEHADHLNQG